VGALVGVEIVALLAYSRCKADINPGPRVHPPLVVRSEHAKPLRCGLG
jgi:hypothetical protein